MAQEKKELAVAALENGTVIDHIPSTAVFEAIRILGLEQARGAVTIGYNLPSTLMGTKAIIKVADTEYPPAVLNRIALIAPEARVNIVKDYKVVEKKAVSLPDTIVGLVRCPNPKCITNNEPMATRFTVVARAPRVQLRCDYCSTLC